MTAITPWPYIRKPSIGDTLMVGSNPYRVVGVLSGTAVRVEPVNKNLDYDLPT